MKSWLRLLIYVIIGPPVGGIVTLAAFGPLAFLWDGTVVSLREDILPMLPAAVFLGYVLGTLPALVIGVLDAVLLERGLPTGRRLAWCALAGAGASMPAATVAGGMAFHPLMAIIALAGAVATLVSGAIAAKAVPR